MAAMDPNEYNTPSKGENIVVLCSCCMENDSSSVWIKEGAKDVCDDRAYFCGDCITSRRTDNDKLPVDPEKLNDPSGAKGDDTAALLPATDTTETESHKNNNIDDAATESVVQTASRISSSSAAAGIS